MEPKSSMAIFCRLVCAVNSLLPFAVQDALGTSNESKDKNQAKPSSTGAESPDAANPTSSSEMLNFLSDIKGAFSEASYSLNLFGSYLEEPSQESAEELKLLSDRRDNAYNNFFTAAADNTDLRFFFDTLDSAQDNNAEHDKSDEFDHESWHFDISPGRWKTPHLQDQEHGKVLTTSKGDCQNRKKEAFRFLLQPKRKRKKELEKELDLLQEQLKSLKIKNDQYEETLFELGKFDVEETAKKNEEKKSEIFHEIYHSPLSGVKRSLLSTTNGTSINDSTGCPKDYHEGDQLKSVPISVSSTLKITTASGDPLILNASPSASFNEQSACGAETLVQGSVSSTFSGNSENSTPTTPNSSVITTTEKANGGNVSEQLGDEGATSNIGMTSQRSYDDLSFSVQQHDSGMESITLANKPTTSVATTLYNNYKLLLLTLAQRLLSSEIVILKDWAAQNFSIVNPQNATDVLFQLDEKQVINALDLGRLCNFFQSIIRFDLVYIVDAFLLGDYSLLRQNPASKNRSTNGAQNSRLGSISRSMNPGQYSIHPPAPGIISKARKPEDRGGAQNSVPPQTQQGASLSLLNSGNPFSRFSNENYSITAEQTNVKPVATEFTSLRKIDVGVAENPVTRETRPMTANTSPRVNTSTGNNAQITQSVSSNGLKHSKFQRSDTEGTNVFNHHSHGGPRHQNLDQEDNWLCSHYKRHCYVKFECCDKFWPCHRCHNNQSTCGQKKLKSRDTRMLKCAYCNKVQEFGEHCCNCGAKFANYYCGLCKHLTGNDDHPYHCEKCGICRIHGDRSFHCDVCGVCLDVQLRGNHKCREGSAHDECCICLEDAFTGCQILPCSHKVHKECATQMIRRGITRCPICRESFAHKLERRPFPNSRKRAGK